MQTEAKELIQVKQYEEKGPYHRRIIARSNTRYEMGIKLAGDIKDSWCLDFGGGDGAMASRMANKGAKVVIFDPIRVALGYAHEADKRLGLAEGRTSLPFPDGKFKVVTMLETLEHIPDVEEMKALKEVYRVLADNGRLVISVPSVNQPLSQKHWRHYSLSHLQGKLEETGFKINKIVPYRFLSGWWSDTPIVRKMVNGIIYGMDSLIRSVNGHMGSVQTTVDMATDFIILANK